MTWAAAIGIAIGFLFLAQRLRLAARATVLIQSSRAAMVTLRNGDLDDLTKERAMRGSARELVSGLLVLLPLTLAAFLLPIAAVWILELAGWVRLDEVLELTITLPFLGAATLVTVLYVALARSLTRRDT